MRKLVIPLLIAILMAITNPSLSDFRTYVQTAITEEAYSSGNGGWVDLAKGIQTITGYDAMARMTDQVMANTKRDDYLILSLYTVRQDEKSTTIIGLFKRFFVLRDA